MVATFLLLFLISYLKFILHLYNLLYFSNIQQLFLRLVFNEGFTSRFLADLFYFICLKFLHAIQLFYTPENVGIVGNGYRCPELVVQRVFRQYFKLFSGQNNLGRTFLVVKINFITLYPWSCPTCANIGYFFLVNLRSG